ncbi:MAG TPA: hypothetical protein VFO88_08455 [Gaiellaceae bacterium]|nr:hypothetical protein [Gaiellaceae bacterium]
MVKRLILLAGVAVLAAAFAAPAVAAEPVRDTIVQNNVVQGQTSCGFLVWEIHLTAERFRFFDNDGNLVRVQVHIREDNTLTNVTTGETFREGPVSFMQTTIFTDEGPRIVATGMAVNIFGQAFKDVGRVVINPFTGDIEFSAGPHPLREAQSEGNVLEGFCGLWA